MPYLKDINDWALYPWVKLPHSPLFAITKLLPINELLSRMEVDESYIPEEEESFQETSKKESGKRGRRPGRKLSDRTDIRAKLERSRQSARECRARKKLRYQYLEELVSDREKAIFALKKELEMYHRWCQELDAGIIPEGLVEVIEQFKAVKKEKGLY